MVAQDGFSAHVLCDGRFCLDEPIGQGTAAYVWRATDLATLEKVAVKIFSSPLGAAPQEHQALWEAAALRSVSNPHVVRIISDGLIEHPHTGARTPYLALELVPGTNLHRYIAERGAQPAADVARRALGLVDGLSALHSAGFIHGDIKPSNILLDAATGNAKITDLGTAVCRDRSPAQASSYGSLPYMSPEQVRGLPLGTATDVYSLGLVLLECLTGVRPFDLPAVESLVVRTVRSPEAPPTLTRQWVSLLMAMTAMEAQERPTAEQCRQLLARLAGSTGDPEAPAAAAAPHAAPHAGAHTGPHRLAATPASRPCARASTGLQRSAR